MEQTYTQLHNLTSSKLTTSPYLQCFFQGLRHSYYLRTSTWSIYARLDHVVSRGATVGFMRYMVNGVFEQPGTRAFHNGRGWL